MSDIDILNIDANIRKTLEKEISNVTSYREKLGEINKTLELQDLPRRIKNNLNKSRSDIQEYILDLETRKTYNFYLIDSIHLIEEYKIILKTPIKMNFMGKVSKNNKEKQKIIDDFLLVACKYMPIDIDKKCVDDCIYCLNCSNKKDFDVDGSIYTCMKCFTIQNIIRHTSSYNDIDRVNISSKYMYDRKVHFRDCINQYQGKQNSTIPTIIYTELEDQFSKHHLLDETTDDKLKKFANVTKNHVLMFLKELGWSNHYENVHLIHYNMTGIKPDDITYLETRLLDDFDILTEAYDKHFKNIKRKNFINTQYVLYQFLRRYNHPCDKDEFIVLKTIDRQFFHDDVCSQLFAIIGWNHSCFY